MRILSGRTLGAFFLAMAGVVFIDWVLAMVLTLTMIFFGEIPPTIASIFPGDLYLHSMDQPFPFFSCICRSPTTGFPVFCEASPALLGIAVALAVISCLIVNLIRTLALLKVWPHDTPDRWWVWTNLPLLTSAVLAVGFTWGIFYPPIYPGGGESAEMRYGAIAGLMPPLFILVTVTTGRRLRRRPPTN